MMAAMMAIATDPKSRLFGLVWCGSVGVVFLWFLTMSTASSYSMKPDVAITFSLYVLSGPFAKWMSGPMTAGQILFTIFVSGLLVSHPVRPSIATFILTTSGVLLWLLSGWIWLLMLA
jgi:hypothetical protein